MKGRLRFFNQERGWGLIQPDGRGLDIFVHVSQVIGGQPQKGERCVFDVTDGGKVQAVNVLLVVGRKTKQAHELAGEAMTHQEPERT